MDQSRAKFASIFKTTRKLFKLNQSEFARKLGITQGTVSKLEKGLLGPDAALWYAFCMEFGLYADATYRSGYLFFKEEVDFKGDEFKMGKFHQERLIKVKEITPLLHSMNEYQILDNFYDVLKNKGIEREALIVPEYEVPFEVLKTALDVAYSVKSSKILMNHAIKYFVESKQYLVEELGYSYKKLIKDLNQNDPYLNIELVGKKVNINLVSNLKFSLDEAKAMKTYFMYKLECVANALSQLFEMKGVKLVERGEFSYSIGF